MQKIKLENQKILKMRDYHYISIPKAFIDNGLLSVEKKYKVILIESGENVDTIEKQKPIETITEESS